MKKVDESIKYDVGVIVGRFQVPYLHEAHKDLIETVKKEHSKVIIFLGLSHTKVTQLNPLDFESRKQMLLDAYPDVTVLYIKDVKSDQIWSSHLDSQIADMLTPAESVVLYGSRDSFISHYTGKYPTQELVPEIVVSGTELRRLTSKKVKCCPEFREGVIWAASNRYPSAHPTVDVAILDEHCQRILLGRKPYEQEYRFIGGFVDTRDACLESTVRREVKEEAGDIEISNITYVCSGRVDDWRYRYEVDKIMTSLFACNYMYGSVQAGDDIAEVRWFDMKQMDDLYSGMEEGGPYDPTKNILVDNHMSLMAKLLKFLKDKNVIFETTK